MGSDDLKLMSKVLKIQVSSISKEQYSLLKSATTLYKGTPAKFKQNSGHTIAERANILLKDCYEKKGIIGFRKPIVSSEQKQDKVFSFLTKLSKRTEILGNNSLKNLASKVAELKTSAVALKQSSIVLGVAGYKALSNGIKTFQEKGLSLSANGLIEHISKIEKVYNKSIKKEPTVLKDIQEILRSLKSESDFESMPSPIIAHVNKYLERKS